MFEGGGWIGQGEEDGGCKGGYVWVLRLGLWVGWGRCALRFVAFGLVWSSCWATIRALMRH